MEESYETFEEELWPPRAEPPPQKPTRQIRRPEMYASRTVIEEGTPVTQQQRSEPKTSPREPSFAKPSSFSIQNPTQTETPWENVTLNRCLFVAITILVLTSGFQRLHEAFRGEASIEEEEAAVMRSSGVLRRRGQPAEPETSLWEVVFSWLPNLDDEEDDDEKIKKGKSKRGVTTQKSRGLRNRPLPDKKLLKQKDRKLKDKRARRAGEEEVKGREKKEDADTVEDEKDEDEQIAPKKMKLEDKKKNQKG